MMAKRYSKNWLVRACFGCLFGIMMVFGGVGMNAAYAEPIEVAETVETTEDAEAAENVEVPETDAPLAEESASCSESLGALGWLVCPGTGKISEAVDFLYDKIEDVLVINPVEMKDGSPIYEIWKYMQGITNVLFIILCLVMVYSQITGVGITNYGLKKTLPKLIVGAILVNLSFIICSLAVDASNIIGESLRGVFETIEANTLATTTASGAAHVTMTEIYSSLAGGAGLTIGAGAVAFEAGAIWMLIPTVLGALAAVVIGLITIALRQAVVAILIMIAPLAIMAYIMPNTEKWFKQWKDLLFKMLIFYPMFSLLFGASSLAGWAIIVSASNGFWVLIGVAVQIFPLIFSWKLMSMSGTFLSGINAKLTQIASAPLATNRAWAESRRELTKQRNLAARNAYTPSLKLAQFLSDRRIMRAEETNEHAETVKLRGQAYAALRNYRSKNMKTISREGEDAYEMQYRRAQYQQTILRHQNNFNKGIGGMGINAAQNARLEQLDNETIRAFDKLKMEQARTEKIDYDNAVGFHKRMEDAMNAHFDSLHVGETTYKRHNIVDRMEAEARYKTAFDVMDGNLQNTQYTAAFAAHAYDAQAKIISSKFQKYFELTPPTRDVRYRLEEFSKYQEAIDQWLKEQSGEIIAPGDKKRAVDNIDAIVSGLRVLNMRGDTDFVKDILDDLMDEKYGGLELGTHASQALAGFLMFDVKDSDPWLRRFGKYINLETARMYDKNKRQKATVDYEEYVKGYHEEPDGSIMYAKKDMVKLMEGTSLDGIERTAMSNYRKSVQKAYTDENGNVDYEGFRAKMAEVETATLPQFISANMKFLSGSEQITSSVLDKTGYKLVQDDKTGKTTLVPIWEDEDAIKSEFGNIKDPAELDKQLKETKRFYMNNFLQYLRGQTPGQVLGFRSDYEKPLMDLMFESYFWDEKGERELTDRRSAYDEIMKSIDEDNFGLTDEKEIEKRRQAAKKGMHDAISGEQFRSILYDKGKLEQIEKSKRSGAANNAKDWVRKLLLLDSESGLRAWILKHQYGDGDGDAPIEPTGGDTPTGGAPTGGFPMGGGDAPASDDWYYEKFSGGDSGATAGGSVNLSGVVSDVEPVLPKMSGPAPESPKPKKTFDAKQKERKALLKMLAEVERQQKAEADANLTPKPRRMSVYKPEDVASLQTKVQLMWEDISHSGADDEYREFYEESYKYIVSELTETNVVAIEYARYFKDNPDGESYELKEYLINLLKRLLED